MKIVKRHPLPFAVISFVFVILPSSIDAIWSLVEKIQGASVEHFPVVWFTAGTAPVGLILLGLIFWEVKRRPSRDEIEPRQPNAPRVASPELFFEDIDCKFIGDNPPLLQVKWGVMPTGSMDLEQAGVEVLGETIPFSNWEVETVSPSVTFVFTNQCEIKGKLPKGKHDIRILVLANREPWASDWQTITYSPSVLDRGDSQT